ncbi:MAG: PAS domain S-box protein [Candidatus Omnitrophica bacterium]|nr:PAS domain S-box protein [Candidatus Omnitrophota bacterium]
MHERFSKISLTYALSCAGVAVWYSSMSMNYMANSHELNAWWIKTGLLFFCMTPSMIIDTSAGIIRRTRQFRTLLRVSHALSFIYFVTILLGLGFYTGIHHYEWGHYPVYGLVGWSFVLFFAGAVLFNLWCFRKSSNESDSPLHKKRLRAFAIAYAVCYLGAWDFLPVFGVDAYPYGPVPVGAGFTLMAFAIWQYRLVAITPSLAAKHIIKTMPEALFVFDNEGILSIVNQSGCDLLGRQETDLVEKSIVRIDDSVLTPKFVQELIELGNVKDMEIVHQGREGQRWLSLSSQTMTSADGNLEGLVIVARDITERKSVENGILLARTELANTQLQIARMEKLQSMGRLVAGVAHEVLNPLTTIKLGAEVLRGRLVRNEDLHPIAQDILDAGVRAEEVLKRLIKFSTSSEFKLQECSLNRIVESALLVLEPEIKIRQVKLELNLASGLPALQLDAGKIEQALVNVLSNAIQAAPIRGSLKVSSKFLNSCRFDNSDANNRQADRLRTGDSVIAVDIEDNGPGISESLLGNVFDPFYTTKPTGKAMGLGLTVAQKIVELHGGTIHLRNRKEGGVCATVCLKVSDPVPH